VFNEPLALDMALDLLCERGYTAVLDYRKERQPDRVDLQTGNHIVGLVTCNRM
jgi:hypothetical protein